MKLVRLFHLIDSSIPTGAFAYSYGLESAVGYHFIKNSHDLKNYLYGYIQQIASLELPFISSIFSATDRSSLRKMLEDYEAMILVPAIQKASVAQGKNWFRLLLSFYPDSKLEEVDDFFFEEKQSCHFTFLMTLSLKKVGYSLKDIQDIFLHMALRDQISAAIRLGVLGPMEGHALQHQFYDFFEKISADTANLNYKKAYKSAFMLELFQSNHENIYSKLFQN